MKVHATLDEMLAVTPRQLEPIAMRLRSFCRLLAGRLRDDDDLRDTEEGHDTVVLAEAAADLADELWRVLGEQALHGPSWAREAPDPRGAAAPPTEVQR